MNAIPAIVMGVMNLTLILTKKLNPVLYAACKCKIKEIYSIGGSSAIAAVAYGTKKTTVNKIVARSNVYSS